MSSAGVWEKKMKVVPDAAAFEALLAAADSDAMFVLYFWVDWLEACAGTTAALESMATNNSNKKLLFLSMDAEACGDVAEQFPMVDSVPAMVIVDAKKTVVAAHEGADPDAVLAMVNKHVARTPASSSTTAPSSSSTSSGNGNGNASSSSTSSASAEEEKEVLMGRLRKLVKAAPVMLFMKGSPDGPKCGFSKTLTGILKEQKVQYGYFDILTDDSVRQGLKELSDWPTFPQLYVNGELLGGLDVVRDMISEGEFAEEIGKAKKKATPQEALDARLKSLIESNPVMLFMKGDANHPQCGFSNKMVGVLREIGVVDSGMLGTFDILTDNEVRQGMKTYSDWPTFPQLYVKGELIGGLDILMEMIADGEHVSEILKPIGITQ
jgi:Grx4 family monothiol glutaredoxin